MRSAADFLEAIKRQEGIKSDYALAKFLGESQQRISRYRVGKSLPDVEMCIQIEKILGLPEGVVAASIEAERAKCPPVRAMWRHVAQALSGGTAALLALAASPALLSAYSAIELCILC